MRAKNAIEAQPSLGGGGAAVRALTRIAQSRGDAPRTVREGRPSSATKWVVTFKKPTSWLWERATSIAGQSFHDAS